MLGLGRLSRSRSRWLNVPLVAFIEVFRCTPLLVQIVWFYYALPVIVDVADPGLVGGDDGAVVLHRVRSMPRSFGAGSCRSSLGSWDAARALGLKWRWPAMRVVVLPQAVRRMIPPFMNQSIIATEEHVVGEHHRDP